MLTWLMTIYVIWHLLTVCNLGCLDSSRQCLQEECKTSICPNDLQKLAFLLVRGNKPCVALKRATTMLPHGLTIVLPSWKQSVKVKSSPLTRQKFCFKTCCRQLVVFWVLSFCFSYWKIGRLDYYYVTDKSNWI